MNQKKKEAVLDNFGQLLGVFAEEVMRERIYLSSNPDNDILRLFYKQAHEYLELIAGESHIPSAEIGNAAVSIARTSIQHYWENFDAMMLTAMAKLLTESFKVGLSKSLEGLDPHEASIHKPSSSSLIDLAVVAEELRQKISSQELRKAGRHPKGANGFANTEQEFWKNFIEAIQRVEKDKNPKERKATKANVAAVYPRNNVEDGITEEHLGRLCKRFAFDEGGKHYDNALRRARDMIKNSA